MPSPAAIATVPSRASERKTEPQRADFGDRRDEARIDTSSEQHRAAGDSGDEIGEPHEHATEGPAKEDDEAEALLGLLGFFGHGGASGYGCARWLCDSCVRQIGRRSEQDRPGAGKKWSKAGGAALSQDSRGTGLVAPKAASEDAQALSRNRHMRLLTLHS